MIGRAFKSYEHVSLAGTILQIDPDVSRYSNYSSIETFNQHGAVDYTDLIDDFEGDPYSTVEQDAGYILTDNLQDRSFRSGLSIAGWKPGNDMEAQAVEWWEFDWEYGETPVG